MCGKKKQQQLKLHPNIQQKHEQVSQIPYNIKRSSTIQKIRFAIIFIDLATRVTTRIFVYNAPCAWFVLI